MLGIKNVHGRIAGDGKDNRGAAGARKMRQPIAEAIQCVTNAVAGKRIDTHGAVPLVGCASLNIQLQLPH